MKKLKSKIIKITMADNSVWEVDGVRIAMERAKYYSTLDYNREDVKDLDQAFIDELAYTLNNDFEIIDWIRNNFNWEELNAKLVVEAKIDYSKEWLNAEFEIIRRH